MLKELEGGSQGELSELRAMNKHLQTNAATLAGTLTETQNELDNLVAEHEKLTREYSRVKQLYNDVLEQLRS